MGVNLEFVREISGPFVAKFIYNFVNFSPSRGKKKISVSYTVSTNCTTGTRKSGRAATTSESRNLKIESVFMEIGYI